MTEYPQTDPQIATDMLNAANRRIEELESTEESMRCDIVDLSQKLSEANAKLTDMHDRLFAAENAGRLASEKLAALTDTPEDFGAALDDLVDAAMRHESVALRERMACRAKVEAMYNARRAEGE